MLGLQDPLVFQGHWALGDLKESLDPLAIVDYKVKGRLSAQVEPAAGSVCLTNLEHFPVRSLAEPSVDVEMKGLHGGDVLQ